MSNLNLSSLFKSLSFYIGATILFLILIEFFSYLVVNLIFPLISTGNRSFECPLFASHELGKEITKEYFDKRYIVYHPFFMYTLTNSYQGKHIHITKNIRHTCYNSKDPDYVIWMFGGSTLFGFFAEDDCVTIPSFVSKKLNKKGYNVKVVNYGVPGYYSTQELIKYLWLLKNENETPNLVIFYDGINDVLFTTFQKDDYYFQFYDYLRDGGSFAEKYLVLDFNSISSSFYLSYINPIFSIFRHSNTYKLINKLMLYFHTSFKNNSDDFDLQYIRGQSLDLMSDKIFQNYLENMKIETQLSTSKNISQLNFWQPLLSKKLKKKFGVWENKRYNLYLSLTTIHLNLFEKICDNLLNKTTSSPISFCYVFFNEETDLFVDGYHTTSKGNEIIADAMLPYIEEKLRD